MSQMCVSSPVAEATGLPGIDDRIGQARMYARECGDRGGQDRHCRYRQEHRSFHGVVPFKKRAGPTGGPGSTPAEGKMGGLAKTTAGHGEVGSARKRAPRDPGQFHMQQD